jgi:hypothetical protein
MEPVPYHFVITLQWSSAPRALSVSTYAAAVTVRPGMKRSEVFGQVLDLARKALGATPGASVLFFSLEPEQMTAEGDK